MSTTPESRDPEVDPLGRVAPYPGETHAAACRRWAREDEIEEDPELARRATFEIAALRDEELLVSELAQRSFETLPSAVRRLYRQNPSNPRIRALYEATMRELAERTDDKLRGALLPAVDRMIELVDSGDEKVALRAATYVFERLRGRTPDVVEHRQDAPFQVVLERIVSGPRIAAAERTPLEAGTEPLEAEIVAESHTGPEEPYAEEQALAAAWTRVARRNTKN